MLLMLNKVLCNKVLKRKESVILNFALTSRVVEKVVSYNVINGVFLERLFLKLPIKYYFYKFKKNNFLKKKGIKWFCIFFLKKKKVILNFGLIGFLKTGFLESNLKKILGNFYTGLFSICDTYFIYMFFEYYVKFVEKYKKLFFLISYFNKFFFSLKFFNKVFFLFFGKGFFKKLGKRLLLDLEVKGSIIDFFYILEIGLKKKQFNKIMVFFQKNILKNYFFSNERIIYNNKFLFILKKFLNFFFVRYSLSILQKGLKFLDMVNFFKVRLYRYVNSYRVYLGLGIRRSKLLFNKLYLEKNFRPKKIFRKEFFFF